MLAILSERHPSVIASCSLSEGRVTYCGSRVEVAVPIESRTMANALSPSGWNIVTQYSDSMESVSFETSHLYIGVSMMPSLGSANYHVIILVTEVFLFSFCSFSPVLQ